MKRTFLIGFFCAACTGHMAQDSEPPPITVAEAQQRLTAIQAELFQPGTGHQIELSNEVRDLLRNDVGLQVFKDAFAAAEPEARTNLLLVADLSPTKELLGLLMPAMQVPTSDQHAKKLNGGTVTTDVDFRNSLLSADVYLDTYLKDRSDPKMLNDVIDSADPRVARYIGAQLASNGALTPDAEKHLMARGINAKRFRPLTSKEHQRVTRPNFGSHPAMRNAARAAQSANDGPMTAPPTISMNGGPKRKALSIGTGQIGPGLGDAPCLVGDWWKGGDTLDYWFSNWYCDDSFIADTWSRFHMGDGRAGWGPSYGYDDPCNMDYPLARTLAAIYVLNFAGTWSPGCDQGDPMINWASCYAASNISFIQSQCENVNGGFSALTSGDVADDHHTELFPRFFFNQTIVSRAATLFHEARHADGVCAHTSGCSNGKNGCDPQYGPNGCVGFLSADGSGSYTFSVQYFISYLESAQSSMINDSIRKSVRAEANSILMNDFEVDPCFDIRDLSGATEMTCEDTCNGCPCPSWGDIPGCIPVN